MDRGSGFYVPIGAEPFGGVQNIGNTDGGGTDDFARTAARYWSGTITAQLGLGFIFSLLSCWLGLTLSYVLPETPSGPAIVLVAGTIFVLSALFGPLGLRGQFNATTKS